MHNLHRTSQHVNGDFHWFRHTRGCRVVTQLVIVALLLVDAPLSLLEDAFAQSTPVFGPADFVRTTGPPQTVTRTFAVATPTGAHTLCLANGGQHGQYARVSSAVVTLNNTQVLRPSDFNQNVGQITRAVTVRASNTLKVEVRSQPGSGFTLAIVRGGSSQCPWAPNRPPVADAGTDQSAPVTTTITLDGSESSDVDGNSLTYQWSLAVPAGSTATLSSTTVVKPTFTIDKPGTYTAQLIVNDGTINSEPDTVLISTVNAKPVAQAGDDQSGTVGRSITLDGSGSSDVDGDSLTYQWSLTTPAGSTATLSSTTAVKPTFTIDKPGSYTAQLVVHDGTVASEPDAVVISTVNSKPVADAGDDQTVPLTSVVTLSGVDSSDVDGDTLTYRWVLLSTPTGSTATLSNGTTATPSFTADKPGNYTAQLIVNDGTVDSDPDTVVISTLNSKPVADAGADQTGTVNQLVTLDGSGSTDADNDPLTYQWSLTTKPATSTATLSDPTAQKPTFTPDFPGLYVAQVIVSDGTEVSDPDTVSITINPLTPVNQPPTITSTAITTAQVGQAYSYDVQATDPDAGDTLTYSLTTAPTGMTINTSSGLIAWTPAANQTGPQNVTVQVSDGHAGGAATQDFLVTVSTAPPANQPPTITSTAITTGTVGQPYTYDVEATDPDAGDVLTYSLTTFPTGMTIDETTGVISWTPVVNQADIHDVTVRVQDQGGLFVTQSFSVTVSPAPVNRPPVAQDDQYAVRHGQTLTVPAPGVLGNDTDPDNNPLTAQLVTDATKGALNLSANGSLTYTPTEPPPGSSEPLLKFTYRDADTRLHGTLPQPLVIDLDKDGVAEIVSYAQGPFGVCRLIAVHGNDGSVAFSVNAHQPAANPPIVLCDAFSELAAGDIDGDGFPEIIAVDGFDGSNPATDIFRRQLIAFEHDGTYKWTSQDVVDDPLINSTSGFRQPLIADINGDGTPEIVVGYAAKGPLTPANITEEEYVTVFDNQGRILWTARGGGSNSGNQGNLIAQDIDLDGDVEILYGDDVYDHQGNRLWSASPCLTCLSVNDVAVANLDADPFPEIVYLDRFDQLYVYEHTGGKKWGPLDTGSGSSLLTIGDADGDGKAEILLTSGTNIVVTAGDGASSRLIPVPFSTIFNLGNTTIFDLNGDGKPELIHLGARGPFDTGVGTGAAQLGAVFIFDGQTGTHLYSIKSPNGGSNERPVVADVNGDGAAEIVTGGWNGSPLLHVFEAKNGQWAKARPIYNQYNYSITNVNSDGTIPARPALNWLTPGLNNYRVNIPLPEERTGDKDQFTYKANDGALDSNTATVKIDILPPNSAPSILSQAPTTASPNLEYLYAVRAGDPDAGETLTFSLAQAPAGMTISSATGLIRWTPTAGQVGNHVVALKVTDSQGEFAFQGFTITVGSPVTVPDVVRLTQAAAQTAITGAGLTVGTVITSPSATVPAGSVSSQEPTAGTGVPSGSAVNLVISSGPQGVSVPNVVGQTQTAAQTAITGVGLTVGTVTTAPSTTVPAGNIISQTPTAGTVVPLGTAVSFVVSAGVITLDGLSSIVVEPTTPLILVDGTQAFTATGIFNDGTSQNLTAIVTWTSSSPSVASIAATGVATGLANGTTTINATVSSIIGNTTLTVRAKVPGDSTDPTAAITTPADEAEVTSPIDVIGTATDANFLKYELAYAPAGETTFTLLSTGTTAVTNSVLGKLDPTLLINDLYTLRLTVFDRGGNQAVATVTVQVTREQKVGLFSITFQDLSIPLSGIPITINRTYDSRDKRNGDFGFGWRLDVQTMRIRTNRVLGTGWVRQQSGASITLSPTDAHKVSLTLPDGKVEEFDMQVSPTSGLGSLDFTAVTGFPPRPGTLGTLAALTNNGLAILNAGLEDELVDDDTLNTYNPQLFRYTTGDGTRIEIHRTEGVKKVTDLNGNTLTFGPTGIIHSAGKSVTFTRDAQNRITQITDPSGNSQNYAYNANGDLISHTDQASHTTRFTYNSTHGLLQIIDPLNRTASRNEYDTNGRLIAVTDAKGNRTTFNHDLSARQEITTDRLGRVSVYSYDDKGNVLSRTNPVGETTTFTYDGRGNQLTERDALGHTTTHAYDSRNNLTSTTDPLGHTTTYSYNSRDQVVSITDPLGHTGSNGYDANGNLTSQTDALGRTTSISYDGAGNPLAITDPLGNVSHNTYDTTGNRTSLTQASGNVISFSYDANSNLRSQADTTGPAYTLTYNAMNRPTNIAIGSVIRHLTYDAVQQITKGTSPEGHETQVGYDALGQLSQITPSSGPGLSQTYDAEGNVSSQSDFVGNVIRYTYDGADRLTQTTFPDGTTEQRAYDAAGNLIQVTNALGHTTSYTYDAAGRQTSVIDALENVTTKQYDAAGNLTAETDPLGHTTQYTYDAANQLVTTTFADGSTEQRSYDGLGRLTQTVGPTGNSFTYTHDALGRLTAVRDGLGHSTLYEYNAAGQRSALVDANGNRTTFTYDDHGRLLSTTFPGGNTESTTYDIVGRELSTTNGNGDTLQYLYDTRGFPSRLTLPGGAQETYSFSADGLINAVTDARGLTQFAYHATSRRLVRVTEPDGRSIRYTYDAVGNRTLMAHAPTSGGAEEVTQYTYDALNRMTEVTDPSGGITRYTYDAGGNQTSIVRPNGTSTTLTYNNRNRVTVVTHRNTVGTTLAREIYTLDAAGNRTGESHADGSRVEYSYDTTGKVTTERHFDAGDIITQSVSYSYDAVGNLVGRTGTLGTASFTYNANNQLVSGDGITYVYDGAGNLLSETDSSNGVTRYTYDARGRLMTFQSPTGAPTTYTYDFRGIRQTKSGPGGTVNFLIDRNNATGFAQVVRESDATGATLRSYVYGTQLVAQNEGGILSYYHTDSLGSVRLLTSATGTPTDTYGYSAYGQVLSRTGTSANAYQFAGEQQDGESNLYYLRARYYSPAVGRFLSRDPFGGDTRNPLSLHKYLYAHGNPVNLTDPSGLESLIELSVTQFIQTQMKRYESLEKFRKGKEKVEKVGGLVAKSAGAYLGAIAVIDSFSNLTQAIKWFGPLFALGIVNTFRVAEDLARKPTIFEIGSSVCAKPGAVAFVNRRSNKIIVGKGAQAKVARVNLCRPFLFSSGTDLRPMLPELSNQEPSMAGIMLHEFTHITLGTRDATYAHCTPFLPVLGLKNPLGFSLTLAGGLGTLGFGDKANVGPLENADNYRCFAEDSFRVSGD